MTQITFVTHSLPSCYVTFCTQAYPVTQVIWVLRKPTLVFLLLYLLYTENIPLSICVPKRQFIFLHNNHTHTHTAHCDQHNN